MIVLYMIFSAFETEVPRSEFTQGLGIPDEENPSQFCQKLRGPKRAPSVFTHTNREIAISCGSPPSAVTINPLMSAERSPAQKNALCAAADLASDGGMCCGQKTSNRHDG